MKIVIIDDMQLIRMALCNILTDAGHSVIGEASAAAEGIKLVAQVKPDLIILDYDLGKYTGLDVLRAIRHQGDRSKVLLLTSTSDAHVLSQLVFATDISALVLKSHQKNMLDAIDMIQQDQVYFDMELMRYVVQYQRIVGNLPPKHADIIYWMSKGLTNDSISEKMDLGVRTISNYRSKIRTQIKNDALKQISAMISGSTISDSCS